MRCFIACVAPISVTVHMALSLMVCCYSHATHTNTHTQTCTHTHTHCHAQGQGIYAFVILKEGYEASDTLKKEMWTGVRTAIGAFAAPDVIHWVSVSLLLVCLTIRECVDQSAFFCTNDKIST